MTCFVLQLVTCSWRLNYNYFCQPVTYSRHPDEMRVRVDVFGLSVSSVCSVQDFFD